MLQGRCLQLIDVESTIFNRVAEAFSAAYPHGSRYGEPVTSPASFPCLTVIESDNYTYDRSLTAELLEHNAWIVYDVNVYSNLASGAKQECRAIMKLVDFQMQNMGFTRIFCNQTKNQDNRIYRISARYRGVVSEDYRIYRK